jgi:hypothetical protein
VGFGKESTAQAAFSRHAAKITETINALQRILLDSITQLLYKEGSLSSLPSYCYPLFADTPETSSRFNYEHIDEKNAVFISAACFGIFIKN